MGRRRLLLAVAGGAVIVAAGIGLLVWALVRDDTDPDERLSAQAKLTATLTSATTVPTPEPSGGPNDGFQPDLRFSTPRPLSPPLVRTPDPAREDPFLPFLLNPTTGEVEQLPVRGSFSPNGRYLSTASLDDHGLDVLDIATGERTRVFDKRTFLLNNPRPWTILSWSPDSTQIAISVRGTSDLSEEERQAIGEGLFIANADGSGYTKLSETTGSPDWSPRGDWIVVFRQETPGRPDGTVRGQFEELLMVKADGSEQRVLVPETFAASYEDVSLRMVAWSPTGQHLFFLEQKPRQAGRVIVVDADTGETRSIVESPRTILSPTWAPSGEEIAFITLRVVDGIPVQSASIFDLHLVPSDASEPPRQIANGRFPTWSPDGRYLAFIGNWCPPPDSDAFDLMVFDRTSGDVQTITPLELGILWVEWSPTEELLAFATGRGIYTVRPDGSELRLLQTVGTLPLLLGWTPDGSRIFYAALLGRGICD